MTLEQSRNVRKQPDHRASPNNNTVSTAIVNDNNTVSTAIINDNNTVSTSIRGPKLHPRSVSVNAAFMRSASPHIHSHKEQEAKQTPLPEEIRF